METSEFQLGQTIHCWESGKRYMAHRFLVYLGKDKNSENNILVQSKEHGWDIISLSELPKNSYRNMGTYNIIETLVDSRKKSIGLVYRFHDKNEPVLITVKLVRGVWSLKKDFQTPSWVVKEEK